MQLALFGRLAASSLLLFSIACTPPPTPAGSKSKGKEKSGEKEKKGAEEEKSEAKKDQKDNSDKEGSEKDKPEATEESAKNECCRYCVEGTPCGDKCVSEGEKCEQETGCACDAEKRKQPSFRKGQIVRGLIAADVPVYNTAQGDPVEGLFDLKQAFDGNEKLADKSQGKLTATFDTTMGKFECELYEDKAPYTVANFVGLARGTRPYFDKKEKKWKKGPFYDGTIFHRVIKGFMLQGGDPSGSGTGGPGYHVVDEFDKSLKHNTPGLLSMANRNRPDPRTGKFPVDKKTGQAIANTGSSQFFVTVAKTPHLDNRHSIFGKCDPKIPVEISKVKVKSQPQFGIDSRPVERVEIKKITISRKK